MILESAQIMSTVIQKHGHDGHGIYKSTHKNHPVVIWAGENQSNFKWLYMHVCAMLEIYDKEHNSKAVVLECWKHRGLLPEGKLTPFVNCTQQEFKAMDTISAYKKCLVQKWETDKRSPNWNYISRFDGIGILI